MVGAERAAGDFLGGSRISDGGLINRGTYRTFIYTRKHRLFRARNHSVDTESLAISGKRGHGKKAHFPLLSGELFLRCLEKHCRYDNDCEGGRRKGEFIGSTMAEAAPRAHRHLYAAVYVHGPASGHTSRYEEELFGR